MAKEIQSRLWKSSMLTESRPFQRLVQVACAEQQVEYTPELLRFVASSRKLVDEITIEQNGFIDDVINEFSVVNGSKMDKFLLMAVRNYMKPVTHVGEEAAIVVTLDVIVE